MNSEHTAGPWHVGLRQAEQIVYDARGWAVANATVYHGQDSKSEMAANARLIAAAPDLLAALTLMQAALTEHKLRDVKKRFSLCAADAAASAAIARVRGM